MSAITKNRENEIFEQYLLNKFEATKAKEEGKLVFLGKIKSHFGAEDYLLMNNGKLRQKITQLRLASYMLKIEVGETQRHHEGREDLHVLQNGKS